MKKLIVILIIAAAAAAVAWYTLGGSDEGSSSYRFVTVERGDLESVVSATGTLEAVTTVEVGTQVSGIIEEILVDFNDSVHSGQIIARLDPTLLASSVRDADAKLTRSRAQLNQAERDHVRIQGLFDENIVSENDLNVAQYDLEVARADVESARVSLDRAEQNLAYATITAPISGTVIERNVDVGQTVASSLNTPQLFLIAGDLTRMQILASVDESDIGRIAEGQTGLFTVQAFPDETFEGAVRQVRLQATIEENVVNYTVVVDVNNPDGRLLPGMTATVDFLVETVSDVLKVPNAALRFRATEEMFARFQQRMKVLREARAAEGGGGPPGDDAREPGGPMGAGSRPGGGPGGLMAAMMSGNTPDDVALLWALDDEGQPVVFPARTGLSDGQSTEIMGRRIEEGMQVIVGVTSGSKSSKVTNPFQSSNQATRRPPPPGGGF